MPTIKADFRRNRVLQGMVGWLSLVWVAAAISPIDRFDWLLENVLVFVYAVLLVVTYRRFPFSNVSYALFAVFLTLHLVGSHYTYAETPIGHSLKEIFSLSRNPYDRIVHFGFGFLLAYPMREMFLRWLKFPRWVSWNLPIEITMSIGAMYELVEWAVADIFFPAQGLGIWLDSDRAP